jgi:hypothetical protein
MSMWLQNMAHAQGRAANVMSSNRYTMLGGLPAPRASALTSSLCTLFHPPQLIPGCSSTGKSWFTCRWIASPVGAVVQILRRHVQSNIWLCLSCCSTINEHVLRGCIAATHPHPVPVEEPC